MELQLWNQIVQLLVTHDNSPFNPWQTYTNVRIAAIWFWGVLHDRSVSWSVDSKNWPIHLRKQPLPCNGTMSERLKTNEVKELIQQVENQVVKSSGEKPLYWMMDGKPFPIGGASKDRQAGYGRAVRGKARGYKVHAITGSDGSLAAWRVAPMNQDERTIARRLLRDAEIQGYLLADGNYDSNPLHHWCESKGNLQFVTPPRGGLGKKKRRKKMSDGRRRSLDLLENPVSDFGLSLLDERREIERHFGNWTNWGGGLTGLPPWVRTHVRVRRWIQAKLIIQLVKHPPKQRERTKVVKA